jgi:ribonuclease BN (tRNA processing enzyme)
MLETIVSFKAGDAFNYKGVEIIGTKVVHSKVEGFGVIFNLKDYTIAFSSDTRVFEGFSEQFSGVDILVLNLLRPDSIVCRRHLCTDEVIPYLNKIKPSLKGLLITHFGSYMDSPFSQKNFIPSQIEKFKEKTDINTIIAAEDGLKIKIAEIIKTM